MNNKWFCVIIIFSFLVRAQDKEFKRELVMVQVLFRHGARYSNNGQLLTNNPIKDEMIKNQAQLTSVGMRQMYLLGLILRKELIEEKKLLSSNEFNSSEVHVQSSNVNRALQSAQSFLQGFFPYSEKLFLPENISDNLLLPSYERNVRGHKSVIPKDYDNLALPSKIFPYIIYSNGDHDYAFNNPCPNLKTIINKQKAKRTNIPIKEITKYSSQINEIVQKLEINGSFVGKNITQIYDLAVSLQYLGFETNLTQEEFDLLWYLKSYTKSYLLFTPEFNKIHSSPTLDFIIKGFEEKVSGKSKLKLIIESSHDSQLIPLMMTFRMLSPECLKKDFDSQTNSCEKFPKFSSNFLFELYKNTLEKEYEIKIKYNGKYIKICGDLLICTLEQFKQWIQPTLYTPQEYAKICGVIKDPYQPNS